MGADIVLKIILVGQSGVGKTAILRRYIKRFFPENEVSTIGVDFGTKNLQIDGVSVELKIWDSAGTERFRSLTASYFRNADAAILVYALDYPDSLFELQSWSREVCNYGDMTRILVGNKNDLEDSRAISEDMAVQFALLENLELVVECSAKRDDNIEYLFHMIAKRILDKKIENGLVLPGKKSPNKKTKETMGEIMTNLSPTKTKKKKKKDIFKRFCTIL